MKEYPVLLKDISGLEILGEIREVFYRNTGMVISFHSPGNKYALDFFPKKQRNDFCRLVQSVPEGLRRCMESDVTGLEEAKKKGDGNIYTCHAGLVDVAIPLVYKGKDIGSIYTGQVLTSAPTEAGFRKWYKRLSELGIDKEKLYESFSRVKVVDEERLVFCVRLLSLISNYIITAENEINLQKEVIRKDREIHKREREKIKLEKALKDLTISVLEFNKKKRDSGNSDAVIQNNDIVSKAQIFIRTNYAKNIRLEDVSSAVYLSANYFSSLFRKITGYTFSSYLAMKRIDAAKKLLCETTLPIKEIVYRVGFDDYNYFNRTFKKITGLPPAKYRKMS